MGITGLITRVGTGGLIYSISIDNHLLYILKGVGFGHIHCIALHRDFVVFDGYRIINNNLLSRSPNPCSYFSQGWSKSTDPSVLCWITVQPASVKTVYLGHEL